LIKPLPFPDSRKVVVLLTKTTKGEVTRDATYRDMLDWRGAQSLSYVEGWSSQTANLTGEGDPDRVRAGFITSGFLRAMAIAPWRGRDIAASDDQPGPRGSCCSPTAAEEPFRGGSSCSAQLDRNRHVRAGIIRPTYPLDVGFSFVE